MLFKNISLCNFGRYGDTILFDTTVTPERNVILVNALNDRGKTTLFKAIKFALYGDDHNIQARDWINFENAAQGDDKMYVEIKFEHANSEYKLRRSISFKQTDKGKEISTMGNPILDLFENDVPFMVDKNDTESNKQDWVDRILPKDASQFFFFDGEEIQQYIKNENKEVKKAIEKVLGIKELLNAIIDLNSISGEFEIEYNKNIRRNARDKKDQDALEQLQVDLENVTELIEGCTKSLAGAQRRKIDLDKDLKKHESVKQIANARDDAEENVSELKKSLKTEKENLTNNRINLSLILSQPLLEIINQTEDNPPTKDQWQSQTVKYIIKEHLENCVCGRPIDEETRKKLESKILKLTLSKESKLKLFVGHMLIDWNPAVKWAELNDSLEKVSTLRQNIDKQNSTIADYAEQIKNSKDAESIKELEVKCEDVRKDIIRLDDELKNKEKAKEKLQFDKEKVELKVKSSVSDEQLKIAEIRRNTCKTVITSIKDSIEEFYESRKPKIQEQVSTIFNQLTNNPDLYHGLEIDRDFNIKVVRNDGTKLPTSTYSTSAGASQIVATSMIGGLNKFATKDAPIVIDTPMGRLDQIHRDNLIKYYSKMGKQIIILYQPTELLDKDIQNINNHLASEWIIESASNKPSMSQINRTESYL